MNLCTKEIEGWLNAHPQMKQWLWFIGLWCAGLLSVLLLSAPIKWLIYLCKS